MLARLIPDKFILILIGVIVLASVLPARGVGLSIVSLLSNGAIFSLFFFHGLRLAHSSVVTGLKQWRLQATIMLFTFGAMPLFGLGLEHLIPSALSPEMWLGVLFLCVLPSTVQAAIASSSMAGGNIAASVIAAAFSSLLAVIATPFIFAAMTHAGGGELGLSAVGKVAILLLLPFMLGQALQCWLGNWAARHKAWIARMDRLTIVLAVYVAFSAAVNEGLWQRLTLGQMGMLLIVVLLLIALSFCTAWGLGGALGLAREDRISLLFAGAHKSLATGAPMARILFPANQAGLIIIPLMLYHQIQLILSAWLAARLNRIT